MERKIFIIYCFQDTCGVYQMEELKEMRCGREVHVHMIIAPEDVVRVVLL